MFDERTDGTKAWKMKGGSIGPSTMSFRKEEGSHPAVENSKKMGSYFKKETKSTSPDLVTRS